MVDFIYGRGETLTTAHRPHMFALEIQLYAKWFKASAEMGTPLKTVAENLKRGLDLALEISKSKAYPGEDLESIQDAVAHTLPLIEPYL